MHLPSRSPPGIASAALAALLIGVASADAASGPWHEAEGASLRLVTTGRPDAGRRLRGVLQIELKPGWTTYWIDPGETGVAPSITLDAKAGTVAAFFPPPIWLEDGAAGYNQPVAAPLAFTLDPARPAAPLDVRVFLGVCREICIPLQARLAVDPNVGADDAIDAAAVSDGFAALPRPAAPGFRATTVATDAARIVIEAEAPDGAVGATLFVAGDETTQFGQPKKTAESSGKATFEVPILSRKAAARPDAGFRYVLEAGGQAVEGMLTPVSR